MEPVRTPSQSIVIFIFLMITLFTYQGKDTRKTYTELYQDSEKLTTEIIPVNAVSYKIPKNLSLQDTLYHMVNTRKEKVNWNKFTIFAYPVSFVQASHQ